MKLAIYHGKATPLVAVGKHQVNLLDFAFKYPTWHSYTDDKATLRAIAGLTKRGSIITNQHNQFIVNI